MPIMLPDKLRSGEVPPMKRLQINEIYPARQGEGVSLGVPSIFLRTQFCPVHCVWCDTQYTWASRPDREMDDDAIMAELKKYEPVKNIVFTGGEPMANLQREALVRLVGKLLYVGYSIEFETSGTFSPPTWQEYRDGYQNQTGMTAMPGFFYDGIQYNVSPKPPSAQTKLPTRPEAIQAFKAWPNSWFKFVAMDETDFEWIAARVKEWNIPEERVIIMPEGVDRKTQEERLRWVLETTDKYFPLARVTPRMHTMAFGLQRRR